MRVIIFTLHGRRDTVSKANIALIEEIQSGLEFPSKIGYLEGGVNTFEKAIAGTLRLGATELVILPILLFSATHVRQDIPERLERSIPEGFPYQILEPLGTTQALERFVSAELESVPAKLDILVISHGTEHYRQPFEQLYALTQRISEKLDRKILVGQHLGTPFYLALLAGHDAPMAILPFFLTEGRIVGNIKQKINKNRGFDKWLPTMENRPEIKEAILERLKEIV